MSDNISPESQSLDASWPDGFPEVPGSPVGVQDGFGAAPPVRMIYLKSNDNRGSNHKVDPRNLKGSLFFMEVTPQKRRDAGGEPSTTGKFNALVYDQHWTGNEQPDATRARWEQTPPYFESLTDPEENTSTTVNIRGKHGTFGKCFQTE